MTKILILSLSREIKYDEFLPEIDPSDKVLFLPESRMPNLDQNVLKKQFKKVVPIRNYLNSGEVEYKAFELFQTFRFEFVIAIEEYDILRAAKIRDVLGLPGQLFYSALAFRDKFVMKEILSQNGIKVPEYKKIHGALDLISFLHDNNFPIVLKPLRGAGSNQVFILKNQQDIETIMKDSTIFSDKYDTSMLAERFVVGKMYNIIGLILNGSIIASWPSTYYNNPALISSTGYIARGSLSADNTLTDRLNEYATRVMSIMPIPLNTAFHLEVFVTVNDEIVLCEVASRISGGGTNSGWINIFGINLEKEFIRVQAGLTYSNDVKKKFTAPNVVFGDMFLACQVGVLEKIENHCPLPWVKEYVTYRKVGEQLAKSKALNDGIAEVKLLTASSEAEFKERVELTYDWFYKNTIINSDNIVNAK